MPRRPNYSALACSPRWSTLRCTVELADVAQQVGQLDLRIAVGWLQLERFIDGLLEGFIVAGLAMEIRQKRENAGRLLVGILADHLEDGVRGLGKPAEPALGVGDLAINDGAGRLLQLQAFELDELFEPAAAVALGRDSNRRREPEPRTRTWTADAEDWTRVDRARCRASPRRWRYRLQPP